MQCERCAMMIYLKEKFFKFDNELRILKEVENLTGIFG